MWPLILSSLPVSIFQMLNVMYVILWQLSHIELNLSALKKQFELLIYALLALLIILYVLRAMLSPPQSSKICDEKEEEEEKKFIG